MKSKRNTVLLFTVILALACSPKKVANDTYQSIPIIEKALRDTSSVYFADYGSYPSDLKQLPIGIFDSGTGGLTVLEAFLSMDEFNNESFRYLADQAKHAIWQLFCCKQIGLFQRACCEGCTFSYYRT